MSAKAFLKIGFDSQEQLDSVVLDLSEAIGYKAEVQDVGEKKKPNPVSREDAVAAFLKVYVGKAVGQVRKARVLKAAKDSADAAEAEAHAEFGVPKQPERPSVASMQARREARRQQSEQKTSPQE